MRVYSIYLKFKGKFGYALFLLGLVFVMYLSQDIWPSLITAVASANMPLFLLSIGIGIFCNFVMAVCFNRLLAKQGVEISDRLAVKICFIGQIAKYVPGKIWGMVYQASHLPGLAGFRGVVLANIEMMMLSLGMTLLVAVGLFASFVDWRISVLVLLLGLVGFLFFYKRNFMGLLIKILPDRWSNAPSDCSKQSYHPRNVDGAIFYVIYCSAYISSYFLLLYSAFSMSAMDIIMVTALMAASWVGAALTLIVPAGMGVRELLFILAGEIVLPDIPSEDLIAIAVIVRGWQILQELTGVSLTLGAGIAEKVCRVWSKS